MDKLNLIVKKEFDNMSVKELLKCYNIGKGKIEEIRNTYKIKVNNLDANLDYIVKAKDLVTFFFVEKIDVQPYPLKLDVVYEDDYLLIVNKPSGILIHPDNEENQQTLVNMVSNYYYENKIFRNVRYVHRIDEETSGIVIFAKDFITMGLLNHMIEKHDVKRYYLALCMNKFKNLEASINKPIARDRHVNNKYRVGNSSNSKNALTHYQVIKEFKGYSLVKLLLETGRTHQIRVHMSYLNHPLLGDTLYGGSNKLISRVSLHSYQVKFTHPITNEFLEVTCPLSEDLERLVK